MFLLGINEAYRYLESKSADLYRDKFGKELTCFSTPYAQEKGHVYYHHKFAEKAQTNIGCYWWLRSCFPENRVDVVEFCPGDFYFFHLKPSKALIELKEEGWAYCEDADENSMIGVRPALWINLYLNENEQKEAVYAGTKRAMASANSEEQFEEAAALFDSIVPYNDSEKLASECREKAIDVTYTKAKNLISYTVYQSDVDEALKMLEKVQGFKDSDKLKEETKHYFKDDCNNLKQLVDYYNYLCEKGLNSFEEAQKRIENLEAEKTRFEEYKIIISQEEKEMGDLKNQLNVKKDTFSALTSEKNSLGLFSMRRKKEIDDQLSKLKNEIEGVSSTITQKEKKIADFPNFRSIFASVKEITRELNFAKHFMQVLANNKTRAEIKDELMSPKNLCRLQMYQKVYGELADKALSECAEKKALRDLVHVNGKIYFGKYRQMNECTATQAIEWRVLAKEGEKMLIISEYALEFMPFFDEDWDEVQDDTDFLYWKISPLRKWLNGTFLRESFTARERGKILTTTLKNDGDPGGNTEDKIFLLSVEELHKYIDNAGASILSNRMCLPTDFIFSSNKGLCSNFFKKGDKGCCDWWLRTSRHEQMDRFVDNEFLYVNYSEGPISVNDRFSYTDFGVRPAMWIKI